MPLSSTKFAPGDTTRWLAATVDRSLSGTGWRVRLDTIEGKPWGARGGGMVQVGAKGGIVALRGRRSRARRPQALAGKAFFPLHPTPRLSARLRDLLEQRERVAGLADARRRLQPGILQVPHLGREGAGGRGETGQGVGAGARALARGARPRAGGKHGARRRAARTTRARAQARLDRLVVLPRQQRVPERQQLLPQPRLALDQHVKPEALDLAQRRVVDVTG